MSEVIAKLWGRLNLTRQVSLPAIPALPSEPPKPAQRQARRRLFNRELSDLLFVQRVLAESANVQHPLLERLRFLAISAEILDQFHSVRLAKMKRSVAMKDGYLTADGMAPAQQLQAATRAANDLLEAQQQHWARLEQELRAHGISFLAPEELDGDDLDWLEDYFRSHFHHVLTPFTIDEEHPFPFIASGGLCAICELRQGHILLPLPQNLGRFLPLPGEGHRYLAAENLIKRFWHLLLPGEDLRSYGVFQILRDNDLAREEMNADLRAIVESGLRMRHKANVIKLKVSNSMSKEAVQFVAEQLGLAREEADLPSPPDLAASPSVFSARMVGLAQLGQAVTRLAERFPAMIFPPYSPRYPKQLSRHGDDCFAAVTAQDMVLHWPYESFEPVVRFLDQAADDPDVVAIKQTLYRTNDDSPIVAAMIRAAQNGKTVLAVVELEARDNEESNIRLAKRMEAAGVQLVYGIIGLKIHCKATLVVRMEEGEAITYTHLGTGNYHPKNARAYTDISFFTRDQVIGEDVGKLFSYLTSEKLSPPSKLLIAPRYLRSSLTELVRQEMAHAEAGRPAYVCIKTNAFTDPQMAELLYEASEAGVSIDLIVRRQCVLMPGVPGLSSRIRVKSIVGRFLEHSRIYLFGNGKAVSAESAIVYFGSADLMERNLDKRVETLVPVESLEVRRLLVDGILHANVKDTRQSWMLGSAGDYDRCGGDDSCDSDAGEGFCAQTHFMQEENPACLGSFASPEDWLLGQNRPDAAG